MLLSSTLFFANLPRRWGRLMQVGVWSLLLAGGWPLPTQGQTTIVNYDFNSATAYPAAPAATAPGVTSAATSSQAFATAGGVAAGAGAFTANPTAGIALNMSNSSGTGKYFEFSLSGASLPKYSAFKLYLQSQRSGSGATTLTLQYSVNGGGYVPLDGASFTPGTGNFAEGSFDLSGKSALNAPSSLSFRLLASGGNSSSGTLRLDNFQVQAINTVDPTISNLAPNPVEAGSPGFALAVGGRNFQDGSVVVFNGQDLPTTFSSSTSLTAAVPAGAIATAGSYPVTVRNPAAGSTLAAAASLLVTPALSRWTGASGSSWFEPANWSLGRVPGVNDEVLLDHRFVAASYTVSLDQNVAVNIKSLTVNPGVGDSIFVVVPVANTTSLPLTLSNTGAGAVALAIYDKGVVTNADGAPSGTGIVVAGNTAGTALIYNGGSYRHASRTGHAGLADNLSAVVGTELGIFDFRLPANGPNSYAISASGRTYGTLIFRNRPGQATSNYAGAGSFLNIQGNLIIGAGVRLTTTLSGDLRLAGELRSQGTLQVKTPSSPISLVSQLVLAGTKPQLISGTVALDPTVGLAINNPAGVTLATPVQLDGPLMLISGLLTTSATNLLTMGSAASLTGGSSSSFVNGPLARQTVAGALSNLTFPTGSGTAYRPVVLNATAQDATTYRVTQREGPALDNNKLLASTSALPALTRVSGVRSYTITPAPAANNFSGTVTLSFGTDDRVNAPTDAGLVVGKNSGPGWENIGSSAISLVLPAPAGSYVSGTITSGTFTSFSDFALARTNSEATINPLPVTLTSFAARRQRADVQLSWATAAELNSKHFEVQRSFDGRAFTTVATVAGHGTTAQAQHYTALDRDAPSQALYYRLAQVDADGQIAFGPVVSVAAAGSNFPTPSLFPNPARDHLSVPAPAGTAVQVLDLTGRVLHTSSLPPSGELILPLLPTGAYLLRTADGRVWRFGKE